MEDARDGDASVGRRRGSPALGALIGGALGFAGSLGILLAGDGASGTWSVDVRALSGALANGQWFRAIELVSVPASGLALATWLGLALGALAGRAGIVRAREVPFRGARPPYRLALWLLACGPLLAKGLLELASRLRPAATGPNVLLVVIDTTRHDHMSLYGYGRETTPRLDALAKDAIVFDRAYSTTCWTTPSHTSLFTGLYPVAHGVTQESWSLSTEHLTLAEILWEHGYRTRAMVGNPMVGSALGFAEGYERFDETWRHEGDPASARDAEAHAAVAGLDALLAEDSPRPFFAFVNLIEPHSPYNSGPYLDEFRSRDDVDVTNNHWRAYFAGDTTFTAEELAHLNDLYDAEIRYSDAIVGAFVDRLEAAGALDDTVVVVTSDHGEHFGEHELIDHVFNLYDTNTRVPLLIRYPDAFPAARRDDPVQLLDLFPTLLALAGVDSPAGIQGVDLRTPTDADRPILLSYGYPVQALGAMAKAQKDSARLERFKRRLWAVRSGDWKLIVGDDDSVELYDLARDPSELVDLAPDPEHAADVARLRAELERVLADYGRAAVAPRTSPGVGAHDDETLDELRDLGYAE